MKIGKPDIRREAEETTYGVSVESQGHERTLRYSVPSAHGDLVSDTSDAALVGLLLPAMARGEDIVVAGAVSAELHQALAGPYQALVQEVIPSLDRVAIRAAELWSERSVPAGVATGFSAGIDSYCVLADHHYGEVAPALRVTHLLFNDVGSHEPGGERLFRERLDRLRPVAERIGLPLVSVSSNLDSFYGPELDFLLTHTPRNASVALLLQGGIGRFLYASTYPYAKILVRSTYSLAFCDAVALPLLSSGTLRAWSIGGEYTRAEKTVRVATLEDSYDTLDVCTDADHTGPPTNCSRCFKCTRTLLTLEIAGLLDRYAPSFDLDAWRDCRDAAVREILLSGDPLNREIVRFARSRGATFPARFRLEAKLRRAGRRLGRGRR